MEALPPSPHPIPPPPLSLSLSPSLSHPFCHSVALRCTHPMLIVLHLDSETNCPRVFRVRRAKRRLEVRGEKPRELGQLLLSSRVCHWTQAERLGEAISSDRTRPLKMFHMLCAVRNMSELASCCEMRSIRLVVLNEWKTATSLSCVSSLLRVGGKKGEKQTTLRPLPSSVLGCLFKFGLIKQ